MDENRRRRRKPKPQGRQAGRQADETFLLPTYQLLNMYGTYLLVNYYFIFEFIFIQINGVRLTCFEVCLFIIIIKFPLSPEDVSSVFLGFLFSGEFSPFGEFFF